MQSQSSLPDHAVGAVEIVDRKAVKTCHVYLPDSTNAVSAILYAGGFYSYVKFYPTLDAAERASKRLIERGYKVALTRVPKGLVLWVFEPDAKLANQTGR